MGSIGTTRQPLGRMVLRRLNVDSHWRSQFHPTGKVRAMAVGFRVGGIVDEVGSPDFLHAFFSTISFHLEPNGWGTQYPELMNGLYYGKLGHESAGKVINDVAEIREQLKAFPPSSVVWDIERPNAKPPWGDSICTDISDLSNYFVTSTGRDLFEVLIECLEALKSEGGCMTVEQV